MKKTILLSALLLSASAAFSQLTIQPNSNNPSFMYVKDQVVFVKENIHLEKNTSNDYEASIYLRDGAQLIQGESNATNTGNGYLSVQQKTDPTNSFAYYYWNAPVTNPNHLSGSAGFDMDNIYEALGGPGNLSKELGTRAKRVVTTTAYNGFSDPDLTISTRWFYKMESPSTEREDGYTRINASNPVSPGFGFIMKGVNEGNFNSIPPNATGSNSATSHEQLYEFRGIPNSGSFPIPVQGPDTSNPPETEARMTLAGNPYPSALDLNWVFHDTQNAAISGFFFYDEDRNVMSHLYNQKPYGFGVWLPGGEYDESEPGTSGYNAGDGVQATFYIWDAAGNTHGSGTNATRTPGRIAPIGQGIMFVGTNSNQSDSYIKNSHRRYVKEGEHSVFFRPTTTHDLGNAEEEERGNPNAISYNQDRINSKLRLYVVFDDALTRDLLLSFSHQASDGFDRGFDGPSPGGMDSDAYFPIERNGRIEPFVINGTNYNRSKRIPISLKLHKESKINVYVAEEINKRWENAYLYDNETDTYYRLFGMEVGSFSRRLVLPAGNYENRFFIVFDTDSSMPKTLEVDELKRQIGVFQNNPGQQLEIRNPQGHEIKTVNLFDIAGKLIFSQKNLGDKTFHSFSTSLLSDGVYIVKMTTTSDMQVDYKVIVMNK